MNWTPRELRILAGLYLQNEHCFEGLTVSAIRGMLGDAASTLEFVG